MLKHRTLSASAHLTLSILVTAALTACGGGSAETAANPTADDASTGTVTALKAKATSVDGTTASTMSAATTTTPLANENASFTVNGTQTVQFGAGSSWISKSVTGSGVCANYFFGSDPAPGAVKSCQLVTVAAPTTTTIASENGSFTVSGTQTVQYGAGSSWISMSVTGAGQCSNVFFGKDPDFGVVKSCQIVSTSTAPATTTASAATVTAWVRVAADGDTLQVPNGTTARYGDGVHWVTTSVNNGNTCSVATFGSDPAPWVIKACEVQVTAAAVSQTGLMPVINKGLIPGAATSFTTERVRALTSDELAQSVYQPAPTDVGAFREPCSYSHMSFDDPIAYPGQVGASHLHTFMGNDAAAAASTASSLQNSGGSTCQGGTANRTAYWQPAMVDIRTGQPIPPISGNMYYKLGYGGVKAGTVKTFPQGLRIIAGDSSLTTSVPGPARFTCLVGSNGTWQNTIPNCAIGDTIMADVIFPQCWDGVNLDSPDHKSHMAYASNGCPSDHPVPLPEITVRFTYMVNDANTATNWKLSSDNYTGPGGYSLHADWFSGWDPAIDSVFINNCLNGNLDCHEFLLGDGRLLY